MVLAVGTTLAAGAVFGLALAAPPGPMNAIIAEESVLRGWWAGFTAGIGAMTADGCFCLLSLAGAVTIVQERPQVRAAMMGLGGLLMLWFALGAARDARIAGSVSADVGPGKGFRKAFALALTNPYQILFWLTVGVALLDPGSHDLLAHVPYFGTTLAGTLVVRTGSVALIVGLFGGIFVWAMGFPAALVWARERVAAIAPIVAGVSAVLLGGFGIAFLWEAATVLG